MAHASEAPEPGRLAVSAQAVARHASTTSPHQAAVTCYHFTMTEAECRERLKAHLMSWRETGEILEAERRERVRNADTAESLRRLNSLFDSAVHLHPPSPTSGLVEFYDILARGRR